jgi:hypothetical protein
MPVTATGEGMTGSPHGPAHRRDTGTDERHTPHPDTPPERPTLCFFSAHHIVRRPAPASRPYGRLRGRATPEP